MPKTTAHAFAPAGYSTEIIGKDFPMKEGVNFLNKPFQADKLARAIRNNLNS